MEAFDRSSFRVRLLALNPSAVEVVNLIVTSASVQVDATLAYASPTDAAQDAARLEGMSSVALSSELGETVEAHRVTQVPIGALPSPPSLSPLLTPLPPTEKAPGSDTLTLALFIFLTLGITCLVAIAAGLMYRACAATTSPLPAKPAVRRQGTGPRIPDVPTPRLTKHPSLEVTPEQPLGIVGSPEKESWVTLPLSPMTANPPRNTKALERALKARESARASARASSPVRQGDAFV